MRLSLIIVAGLALSLGLAVELLPRRESAPVAANPTHAAAAVAPLPAAPPAATAMPSPAPSAARLADTTPAPPPDLPTVEVKPRPEHTVPDYTPPPPPVTLRDSGALAPPAPEIVARRAPPAPKQTAAIIISGMARVGNGVSLSVHGRVVALFGVRAPLGGDRCAAAAGPAPRACGDAARDALSARLNANTTVSCRVPPGQRGGGSAAICLDSTGVDLAGFLVGEGFALADTAQSYDYVGAESVARSSRRGLWRYR
ncbi:MAG: thermonuclease family protein [Stellaceae bacterium]